jgi:ADP-ribose pyrophosphatase YjhB (NUDIX family)
MVQPQPNDAGRPHRHPIVAVNAIVRNEEAVLLTRRADNGRWCLPGGLVEFGESVEEALVREIQEEVGVQPVLRHLVGVYSDNNLVVTATARRCSVILAFLCEIGQQVPSASDEVTEAKYFPYNRLPDDLIENHAGRIRDAFRNSSRTLIR